MTATTTTSTLATTVALVLDRSGSMDACREPTVNSVNKYIADSKTDPTLAEADFELMIFDTISIDVIREGRLADVRPLAYSDFEPRDGTPLLDAVGRGIASLDKRAGEGKAVLVIVTDGLENASRKHSYESIKALLDDRQAKGWLVLFLAAGLEAARQGLRMGARHANTASIAMTADALDVVADIVTVSSRRYAAAPSMPAARIYAESEKISRAARRKMGDESEGDGLAGAAPKPSPGAATQAPPRSGDAWTGGPRGDAWGS